MPWNFRFVFPRGVLQQNRPTAEVRRSAAIDPKRSNRYPNSGHCEVWYRTFTDSPHARRIVVSTVRVWIQFLSLDGFGNPMRRISSRKRGEERMESNSGAVRTNSNAAELCSA